MSTQSGRTSSPVVIVIAIVVTAILAVQAFAQVRGESTARTQWEYTVEGVPDLSFESTMSKLGEEGWELVFARRARDELDNFAYECIFKRPR